MSVRKIREERELPYDRWIPQEGTFSQLQKWADGLLEEYGDIRYSIYFGYEGYFELTMAYERDETDKERVKREQAAIKMREKRKQEKEKKLQKILDGQKNERALYEELKKKFGE